MTEHNELLESIAIARKLVCEAKPTHMRLSGELAARAFLAHGMTPEPGDVFLWSTSGGPVFCRLGDEENYAPDPVLPEPVKRSSNSRARR